MNMKTSFFFRNVILIYLIHVPIMLLHSIQADDGIMDIDNEANEKIMYSFTYMMKFLLFES